MKKTIIQFLLIAIILVCFFIFKQKYLNKNKTTIIEETKVLDTKNNEINNLVKSLIYTSKDIKGNQYTIKSKNATYSDFDSDQIIMTDVTATLNLVDSDDINIFAKKAERDIQSFGIVFDLAVWRWLSSNCGMGIRIQNLLR